MSVIQTDRPTIQGATGSPRRLPAWVMDRGEQVVIAGLYAWMVWRLFPDGSPMPAHVALLLLSEGIVLAFVLVRRATGIVSLRPADWLVAIVASLGPLAVVGTGAPFQPNLGVALMLLGIGISLGAKLFLRRSFGAVPADGGVKTDGLYRLVCHPMYLGYMITHLGFVLAIPSAWNVLVYAITWAGFAYRIRAEERVLSPNSGYQAFRARVRYRLVPGVW